MARLIPQLQSNFRLESYQLLNNWDIEQLARELDFKFVIVLGTTYGQGQEFCTRNETFSQPEARSDIMCVLLVRLSILDKSLIFGDCGLNRS